MNREEAIENLNDAMNLLYDPMHPMPKVAINSKLSKVKLFLESEPPAGEFTKETFEEWWKFQEKLRQINLLAEYAAHDAWDYQQKIIDRLEESFAGCAKCKKQYEDELKAKDALLNKIYNYTFNLNPHIQSEIKKALKGKTND